MLYTPGNWLIEEPSSHSFALFFCLAEDELLIPEYPELSKAAARVPLEVKSVIEEDLARSLQGLDLTAEAAKFAPPQCKRTEPLPSDAPRPQPRPTDPSPSSGLPQARDSVPKAHPPSGLNVPEAQPATNPQGQSSHDEPVAPTEASTGGDQTGSGPKRARARGKRKNRAPGGSDRSNHQSRGGGHGNKGPGRGRDANQVKGHAAEIVKTTRGAIAIRAVRHMAAVAHGIAAGLLDVAVGVHDIEAGALVVVEAEVLRTAVLGVVVGVNDIAAGALIVVEAGVLHAGVLHTKVLDVEAGALDGAIRDQQTIVGLGQWGVQ
ncbi:hypothetical protein N0V84_012502 [Fusarium piperis]|uniref:Uncharacterized protein n=1 Tax=Fusarium piperis TaxID=1435070 RepID=A0A9W8T8J8_9HYPO|nr:hypothetical protein N0V84_012502 [Fusarium piperis]